MNGLFQDVRYARQLRRSPGFTLARRAAKVDLIVALRCE
jgi:hypothetical protein